MKAIYQEILAFATPGQPEGGYVKRAVILSQTEPSSLAITGADVDGLGDSDVIAAGSVIITPDKNYIAFADGSFAEKVSA